MKNFENPPEKKDSRENSPGFVVPESFGEKRTSEEVEEMRKIREDLDRKKSIRERKKAGEILTSSELASLDLKEEKKETGEGPEVLGKEEKDNDKQKDTYKEPVLEGDLKEKLQETPKIIVFEQIGEKRTKDEVEKYQKTREALEKKEDLRRRKREGEILTSSELASLDLKEEKKEEGEISKELLEFAKELNDIGKEYRDADKPKEMTKEREIFREKALYEKGAFVLIEKITGEERKDITKEVNEKRNKDLREKESQGKIKKVWKQGEEKEFIEANRKKEAEKQEREIRKVLFKDYFGQDKEGDVDEFFAEKTKELAELAMRSKNEKLTPEEVEVLLISGKHTIKGLEELEEKKKGLLAGVGRFFGTESSLKKDVEEAKELIRKRDEEIEGKMKEKWNKLFARAVSEREQIVEGEVLKRADRAGVEPEEMIKEGIERKSKKEQQKKEKNKEEEIIDIPKDAIVESKEDMEKKVNLERKENIREIISEIWENGPFDEDQKDFYQEEFLHDEKLLNWNISEEEREGYMKKWNIGNGDDFFKVLQEESKGKIKGEEEEFEERFYALLSKGYRPDKIRTTGLFWQKMEITDMQGNRGSLPLDKENDFLNHLVEEFKEGNIEIIKRRDKDKEEEKKDSSQAEKEEPKKKEDDSETKNPQRPPLEKEEEKVEEEQKKEVNVEEEVKKLEEKYQKEFENCKSLDEIYIKIENLFKEGSKKAVDKIKELMHESTYAYYNMDANGLVMMIKDVKEAKEENKKENEDILLSYDISDIPTWAGLRKKVEELL
ncbi:MAG: hypothetical protein PHH17_02605 [Candidatus Pacebacteria bacterium]|nr:hypothetical protein [Candidatus Paceibacterota bacterium]MDD3729135.1 hypothetical protein [Candidatus Paceibacterota bacterium]MDD4466863.1 hypothetical protein [Candidatus Paceibacterota bacterium]MDD4897450.1 hypothetical protein [Candidatus Paceibacterota bacterium]MDD5446068.1 hypothetical protein [Candidatus Paceibacterota bacterium]